MVERFAFLSVGIERCCGRFTPADARSSLLSDACRYAAALGCRCSPAMGVFADWALGLLLVSLASVL